jgi:hypothetical protein
MILNKADFGYKLYEVDSKSELLTRCNQCCSSILGLDIESPQKYYLVELQMKDSIITLGLLNGGHGIEPSIVLMENADNILISSDKSVYLVELKDLHKVRQILCESLVYDIFQFQSDYNKILVVCELEVRYLEANGELIWRYDCDVINDYKIYADYFEITTDEGVFRVALEDGHIL